MIKAACVIGYAIQTSEKVKQLKYEMNYSVYNCMEVMAIKMERIEIDFLHRSTCKNGYV